MHDLSLLPTAVALRSGPRVWMWVDGRSSAIAHATDDVQWSTKGFEFTVSNGLTKVLAPGGSLYFRVSGEGPTDAKPAASLFDGVSAPPPGWTIDYVDGAGGKRVQAFLNGPEGRRVRLGLFEAVPRDQVWLTGELPTTGKASPHLSDAVRFRSALDGQLVSEAPEGAVPLAWTTTSPEQLEAWLAATQPFHNGGPPLTTGVHGSADLDRDGQIETLLCLDGAVRMLDPRCVLIDEVDGETRMYGAGLPWVPDGNPPVAFTVDGAPYVLMVSPRDPTHGFVLRYYGSGWIAEPVR